MLHCHNHRLQGHGREDYGEFCERDVKGIRQRALAVATIMTLFVGQSNSQEEVLQSVSHQHKPLPHSAGPCALLLAGTQKGRRLPGAASAPSSHGLPLARGAWPGAKPDPGHSESPAGPAVRLPSL